MGLIEEVLQLLQGWLVLIGLNCEYWFGVLLLCEGCVVGGIVMQSYCDDICYIQNDCEFLSYVVQYVQIVFEWCVVYVELE